MSVLLKISTRALSSQGRILRQSLDLSPSRSPECRVALLAAVAPKPGVFTPSIMSQDPGGCLEQQQLALELLYRVAMLLLKKCF